VSGRGTQLGASLLAATALHGLVVGSAAAVLSRLPPAHPGAVAVEVDVIAPLPDPIGESVPAAAEARAEAVAPTRARSHARQHHIPLARDPAPSASTTLNEPLAPTSGPPTRTGTIAAEDSVLRAGSSLAPKAVAMVSVTATPRYRTNPKPDYPLACKRRREEGMVLMNVMVQADGLPAAVWLNRGSGHPLLDQSALDAVRRWTFEPGRAAGQAVSSLVVVPVRFSLLESP
jgi:protein TonB